MPSPLPPSSPTPPSPELTATAEPAAHPSTAPHGSVLVSGTGIRKSYLAGQRSVEILHGVSAEVREQEMVAIMGPSGSGKSTFLYCLAGLEQVTSGSVRMLDRDVAELSRTQLAESRRTDVGFVFQSYNLIPTLTAFENVALPWRLGRRKPPVEEIRRTLTELGLGEQIDSRPPQLSGGEQQRVALARVLCQKPKVLFADEPTGALDTKTGAFVLEQLVLASHQEGRCGVIVTHDPAVAGACDRVIIVRDGLVVDELVQVGVAEIAGRMAELEAEAAAR